MASKQLLFGTDAASHLRKGVGKLAAFQESAQKRRVVGLPGKKSIKEL